MAETRIGIIGFGKIAVDQHVPSIEANPSFRLTAISSRHARPELGVPVFADVEAMLAQTELDAVAICTPPNVRHDNARTCLEAGLHVLLEKPTCSTLSEVADLEAVAHRVDRTAFATWHSRFNDTVVRAAEITRVEGIETLDIQWLEDVDKWHPGQDWIFEEGGFGVFDPGINALSIATILCPEPLLVRGADLRIERRGQQPEVVTLALATGGVDQGIGARFDFRHKVGECWNIDVTTRAGTRIALREGGAVLRVNDGPEERAVGGEYPGIYARFAELIARGESEMDAGPLRIVADALLVGQRAPA
jgi:D-galactose 1-dehydrogenase